MGFQTGRTGTGASAIEWNADLLERLKGAYGLRQTSETSETSETPADQRGPSDLPDVSDAGDNQRAAFPSLVAAGPRAVGK